jgi:hypothetical protein
MRETFCRETGDYLGHRAARPVAAYGDGLESLKSWPVPELEGDKFTLGKIIERISNDLKIDAESSSWGLDGPPEGGGESLGSKVGTSVLAGMITQILVRLFLPS